MFFNVKLIHLMKSRRQQCISSLFLVISVYYYFHNPTVAPKTQKYCFIVNKPNEFQCELTDRYDPGYHLRYGKAFLRHPCKNIISSDKVNCLAYFKGCQSLPHYVNTKLSDPEDDGLSMRCDDIKNRNYFNDKPLTDDEREFPILIVKTIKDNYLFQEMELSTIYQPQNYYCFSIDVNSDELFKKRMVKLSKCFPNVVISNNEYDHEKNKLKGYFDCLGKLLNYQWKYAVLLDNNDYAIKTNYEIVRILRVFNGSNDIDIYKPNLFDLFPNINFHDLKLFKEMNRNSIEQYIKVYNGYSQSSLSRESVEYLFKNLNIFAVLDKLQYTPGLTSDKYFLSTLNVNQLLDNPGGLTSKCINESKTYRSITRGIYKENQQCDTGILRDKSCALSPTILRNLEYYNEMFYSPIYPADDILAYSCWRERMFNKTYVTDDLRNELGIRKLNVRKYQWLLPVRYRYYKNQENFKLYQFRC